MGSAFFFKLTITLTNFHTNYEKFVFWIVPRA